MSEESMDTDLELVMYGINVIANSVLKKSSDLESYTTEMEKNYQ